jgi:hypothetical protein
LVKKEAPHIGPIYLLPPTTGMRKEDLSNRHNLLFRISFGLCFFFLYSLPFIGASGYWLSSVQPKHFNSAEGEHYFCDNGQHSWENIMLFRFSPKPKQQDNVDESEVKETENIKWNKWFLCSLLDKLSDDIGSKTSFVYRSSFLQTRRLVALFVLHHSWRTFIV